MGRERQVWDRDRSGSSSGVELGPREPSFLTKTGVRMFLGTRELGVYWN